MGAKVVYFSSDYVFDGEKSSERKGSFNECFQSDNLPFVPSLFLLNDNFENSYRV